MNKSTKLKIITVATSDEGYLFVLKQQLKKANIEYKILGYGQKWGGWIWRTYLILDHLKTYKPDDIVMIIDGYDVLMVGNEKDIMKKYINFNTDIVFGIHHTDSQSYPFIVEHIAYPLIRSYFKTSNKYMKNGGSMMGTSKSLAKIYHRMLKYSHITGVKDDQIALNNISLKGLDYKLDTKSKIFWMWDIDSFYELVYALFNKSQSSHLGSSIKNYNTRPVFANGIKPEIIHGIGHRVMTPFIDPLIGFQHKSRVYVQDDMDMTINILRIIFCIIIICALLFLFCYFYF